MYILDTFLMMDPGFEGQILINKYAFIHQYQKYEGGYTATEAQMKELPRNYRFIEFFEEICKHKAHFNL